MTRLRGLSALVAALCCLQLVTADPGSFKRRWFYLATNLQVKKNADDAERLLERAAKVGYNGVVLADYKLNILDRVIADYFKHAKSFRAKAESLGIEIIPAVMPFGYSDGILAHNPNLAEGVPVREMQLVRRGNELVCKEQADLLAGIGSIEKHAGNKVSGWDMQDGPGNASIVDRTIKHSGDASLRFNSPKAGQQGDDSNGNCRLATKLKVTPFHQYVLSVWLKCDGVAPAGDIRMFVMNDSGRVLSHSYVQAKADQDWTEHHVVFNSLDHSSLRVYVGCWGMSSGTFWVDDLTCKLAPLVNLVRREACPLTLTSADGRQLVEGKDFNQVTDPEMGNQPWEGSYEVYHSVPAISVPAESRIADGDIVSLSYFHTLLVHENQVAASLDDPAVFSIIKKQLQQVDELFQPKTYFLAHDEIRLANHSPALSSKSKSAGQVLADNVRQCVALVRERSPNAELIIWSDMFDPHHNAVDQFYLVKDSLSGSWEGLPKEMAICNWNHGKASDSLKFFAGRGHAQVLAGYYDEPIQKIVPWLAEARKLDQQGIVNGVMYTTWRNNFSDLEAFANLVWNK